MSHLCLSIVEDRIWKLTCAKECDCKLVVTRVDHIPYHLVIHKNNTNRNKITISIHGQIRRTDRHITQQNRSLTIHILHKQTCTSLFHNFETFK